MKSLVIVDIQPLYHQHHRDITPKLLEYIEDNSNSYENIIWFYNSKEYGGLEETIDDMNDYIGDFGIISEEHFIQCSHLNMEKGKTFRPHRHIWKNRIRDVIAQESWVVIQGKVQCIFYDLDNTILVKPILEPGDASFTLEGGHTYEILEDNTLVYEYKTGPYEGQLLDKTFLDEESSN